MIIALALGIWILGALMMHSAVVKVVDGDAILFHVRNWRGTSCNSG